MSGGFHSGLSEGGSVAGGINVVFTLRIDDGVTYMYIGEALAGAVENDPVWRIKRLTQVDLTILYPLGSSGFNQKWSDRLTLSYS